MKYLLYKDEIKEVWFIPRTGERYEFYVKSSVSWQNICDVRSISRTVKKVRNIRKWVAPMQVDETDWQLICGKYPWLAHYDNEVQHMLGTLLLKLFALSIREGMMDVEQEIFSQNRLDEEGLKALTVGEPAGRLRIRKDRICLQGNRLCADISWKMPGRHGGSSNSIYCEGDDFFKEGALRHYLSEKAQERLNAEIRELRELKAKALAHEDGFLVLEMADIILAFRPLPEDTSIKELAAVWISSWNRKYYQFLMISKTEDSVKQRFCEWKSLISEYDGSDFERHDWHEAERREDVFLRDYASAVMQLAEDAGDLYLLYTLKSFLHVQTEYECEYLVQMDHEPHYVAWEEDRTVTKIEILGCECGHFSFFSRVPKYYTQVLLDGKKHNTTWWPGHPQTIRVTEYHHTVNVHLSEEQIRYFWKTTNADPDSKPFVGMPGKKTEE